MKKFARLVPYLVLVIMGLLLLCRAPYGIDWNDESYYLSLLHRFGALGEIPIIDEWNIGQNFAVFMVPLYNIYRWIVGNNDGVVLFIRILFVLTNWVCSLGIYEVFQRSKISKVNALLAALLFLIYAKDNIITMSYYAIAQQMVLLSSLILYSIYQVDSNVLASDHRRMYRKVLMKYFVIGVLMAIAVTANPYIAVPYLLALLVAVVVSLVKKLRFMEFVTAGMGSLVMAILFMANILSRASVHELVHNVSVNLSNQEHKLGGFVIHTMKWIWYCVKPFGMNAHLPNEDMELYHIILFVLFMVVVCVVSLVFITKRKITKRAEGLLLFALLMNLSVYQWNSLQVIGHSYIGLSIIGLLLFFLTNNPNKRLLWTIYIPGALLSLMFLQASDTAVNAVAIGYTISGTAAIVFVLDYMKERREQLNAYWKILTYAVISTIIVVTAYQRVTIVFHDDTLGNLGSQMESGPYKGLYTTVERMDKYQDILEVLDYVSSQVDEEDQVYIGNIFPGGYLSLNVGIGSPTVWVTNAAERYQSYYQVHPEKIPTYLLILDEEYLFHDDNFVINDYFLELVSDGYGSIDFKCGTLYYEK